MSEPSELFWDVLSRAGTIVQECGFCNRTHFVSDGDYDKGELEELRAKSAKEPDKYIEHSECNYISCGELDGRTAVYGCQCNNVARYENFIWNNRQMIMDYLTKRLGQQFSAAVAEAQSIRRLQGADRG